MDYYHLREQYPEIISMDQLYRICHISKRKAKWLLGVALNHSPGEWFSLYKKTAAWSGVPCRCSFIFEV